MSNSKPPCDNPFSILGLTSITSKKDIKNKYRQLLRKYSAYNSPIYKDKEFEKECEKEYEKVESLLNSAYVELISNPSLNQNYNINECKRKYANQLNKYSDEELQFILSENDLEIHGNVQSLKNRVLENVPFRVAELNVWLFNNRPNSSNILTTLSLVKLKRILEIKNLDTSGDRAGLIYRITSNINEDEIEILVNQVNDEYKVISLELGKLNNKQLKIILEKNNLNSYGNSKQLIEKITESLTVNDIKKNIEYIVLLKEKALKRLYSIIGENEINYSFNHRLNLLNLDNNDGIEIKNQVIKEINNYELFEEDIENKINQLLNIKTKQTEIKGLNILYDITGENELSSSYIDTLVENELSKEIGINIKNEIINLIKTKQIKNSQIQDKINELILKESLVIFNEKLDVLNRFTGEYTLSKKYLKLLDENELDEEHGFKIKEEILNLIKNKKIKKEEIIPKIYEIIITKGLVVKLNQLEIYQLKQIALTKHLNLFSTKAQQINEIISNSVTKTTINNILNDIDSIENKLNKLNKIQIQYILDENNLDYEGLKIKLIHETISNMELNAINLYLIQITKITTILTALQVNELNYILKLHSLKLKGSKEAKINEITKKICINDIQKDLKDLNDLKTKLNKSSLSELKYIAEKNKIDSDNSKEILISNILKTNLTELNQTLKETKSIIKTLNKFNKRQTEHLLLMNGLNVELSKEKDIKTILAHVDLKEIDETNKLIKKINKELKQLNKNQLHYILDINGLELSIKKEEQIKIITENLLLTVIQDNINYINEIKNSLIALNNTFLIEILERNNIDRFNLKEENINQIFTYIPIKDIKKTLDDINNEIEDKLIYLYKITGKFKIKKEFLLKLKQYNLNEEDGKEIRNFVQKEIRSNMLNEKEIDELINQELNGRSQKSDYDLDFYLDKLKQNDLNKKEHAEIMENILKIMANSKFTSIIEKDTDKKIIKPIVHKGLSYLILFNDDAAYTKFLIENKLTINKIIRPTSYFIDVAKNNENIHGLIFKTSKNTFILKNKSFKLLEKYIID